MSAFGRRIVPLLLAALALAACTGAERSGLGPDVKRGLAAGDAYARRLVLAGRSGVPDDASTIALGYLERLRLGLGSPFRLADYALHDPRLGDEVRRPLAWAILGRTLNGRSYRVDPAALDCAGTSAVGWRTGTGRFHLELIEGAVAEAGDPRAGELAVRLAYGLAAAEGSVWKGAPQVVAQAAALVRDRAIAKADALRLLREAQKQQVDALQLLVRWRAERRFDVEAPRLAELPVDAESEAMDVAPRLAAAIRSLGARLDGMALQPARPGPGSVPLLGRAAATRLIALSDSAGGPPQTPVVIALGIHSKEVVAPTSLSVEARRTRQRLLRGAIDEERFAAYAALAGASSPAGDAGLPATALGVAAALRSYAQEEIWFPGFSGPSARELQERFGVAVRFDRNVPPGWRPYFRRMLGQSLGDLQRVLPAPDFEGLVVRFGRDPLGDEALALHDPRRRVLYLPPATAAGTIAHELAHDIDWQVAERRYGVTGDYATDIASRGRRDRLASLVRGLASTLPAPAARERQGPNHLHRPAEVFARNVEWFVAVGLAKDGMMNGYLSSVQDEVLTGYGSVQPPDLSGDAGRALVDILDDVAPVYPEARAWYLRAYGPGRVLAPFELLRRVLEDSARGDAARAGAGRLAPPLADPAQAVAGGYPSMAALGFRAVQGARVAGLAAIDAWVCAAPGGMYDRSVEVQRRELVALGAAARARGLATRIAAHAAGRPGLLWMRRRLVGGPWPEPAADSALSRLLAPVADAAAAVDTSGFAGPGDDFRLVLPSGHCGPL